jgi:hypothetical protein
LMAADDKDNSGGSWNSRYFKNPFCVTTWWYKYWLSVHADFSVELSHCPVLRDLWAEGLIHQVEV